MKSKKVILLLLIFSLILTSYSKANNNAKVSENDNITVQEEQVSNEDEKINNDDASNENEQALNDNNESNDDNSNETPEVDPPIDKIYDTVDKNYDNYGLHITYPQITNMKDKDKQKTTNEMIKSEALIALNFYKNSDDTSRIEDANLNINYKIKLESKNILSLTFSGIENDKGSRYPINILYTLNIDTNKCIKLKLTDFINIDEKLADDLRKGKVTEPPVGIKFEGFNYFINDNLTGSNTKYLLKCFEVCDSSYNTSPYTFSYLTQNGLVISTEGRRDFGDHIEIKLKYEDIKDNLKSDNEIWTGILDTN